MTRKPFDQMPFSDLPEHPRRAHPYFSLPAREVTVNSANFGATEIHVRELGEGPPLLLVHGFMTSGYSFRYVVEELARDFHVFIIDLPGCGRSAVPERGSFSAAELATFIGESVDALGIEGCLAVGNSMGGYLCMRLALERPAVFSRLVNIHSPARAEARYYAVGALSALPGVARAVAWAARFDPPRWAHHNVHYWDESLKSLEEAREYGAPLSTVPGSRAFVRYLRETMGASGFVSMEQTLLRRRERSLDFPVPMLLLYAENDPMVSPKNGSYLADLVPSAELRWLEEGSHFAHVDTPGPVVEVLRAFLRPPVADTRAEAAAIYLMTTKV